MKKKYVLKDNEGRYLGKGKKSFEINEFDFRGENDYKTYATYLNLPYLTDDLNKVRVFKSHFTAFLYIIYCLPFALCKQVKIEEYKEVRDEKTR